MTEVDIELTRTGLKNINNKAYELLIDGSMGSGKTTFACYKTILYGLKYPEAAIYVCRKTLPSLRKTSWKEIRELLQNMGVPFHENKSEGTIRLKQTNSVLTFMSLDDDSKFRSINADLIYIEQIEEFHDFEDVYITDLLGRLGRGKACQKHDGYPQMLAVAQPQGPKHWVYKHFYLMEYVKKRHEEEVRKAAAEGRPAKSYEELLAKAQSKCQHATFHYTENKKLPKAQVEQYENLKYQNYELWQRFVEGKWVALSGKVYNNYKVVNDVPTCDFYTTGSDFGYTNPSCTLLTGWRGSRVYIIDEVYVSHANDSEFAMLSRQMVNRNRMLPEHLLTSVGDTQNPHGIERLELEGFPINKEFKKPLIISSVNQVKELELYIHERCENTINEIENYVYEKNKQGETEKPIKMNDHAMDALRYNINNVLTHHRANLGRNGDLDGWDMIIVT